MNNCGIHGTVTTISSISLALSLHRLMQPFIGGTLLKMISCCLLGQSAPSREQHVPTEVSLRTDTATDWIWLLTVTHDCVLSQVSFYFCSYIVPRIPTCFAVCSKTCVRGDLEGQSIAVFWRTHYQLFVSFTGWQEHCYKQYICCIFTDAPLTLVID